MMMAQTGSFTVTDIPVIAPKKLIEVALPLDAINEASAKEKSIRHGHPSTLHLYWARRPLAAARAVIFSQMVNDPSWRWELEHPNEEPSPQQRAAWTKARRRLFEIIEQLVQWDNTTNEAVLESARVEIRKSWRETCEVNKGHPRAAELFNPNELPGFHDPFAGGGAIPLEAQRLGLEAYASDLNPVAVLINKAMIEIPPRFAGRPPANPASRNASDIWSRTWNSAEGLAEDVRYYGQWMRDEAERRIGHLYPKITVTADMAKSRPDLAQHIGEELTVIAWLWARTVRSPSPAFSDVDVPLVSNFMLSAKAGREAYVEPICEGNEYRFVVRSGAPADIERVNRGTAAGKRNGFTCLMSGAPIGYDYIRSEGQAGRLGSRLMAIVVEAGDGRIYLSPNSQHEAVANEATPAWKPGLKLHGKCRVNVSSYGLDSFGDLFTPRQLVALNTLSELVGEAAEKAKADAEHAGFAADSRPFREGGAGATAYAEAIQVYLGFCVDKSTLTNTTQATWQKAPDRLTQGFSRQALPMTWDYAEANPLSDAGGGFGITSHAVGKVLERLPSRSSPGHVAQQDVATSSLSQNRVVSTDPPYYDNISYADLSDYFYVWMRRSLRDVFPEIFSTMAVPKSQELIATPYRHASKEAAEEFFLGGMSQAMQRLVEQSHPAFPVTIYYAFKQAESETELGTASTGWETFLQAVIGAGFGISGTWPMRTELTANLKKSMGALASSIILVCRRRGADAPAAARREYMRMLAREIPRALQDMTTGADGWGSPVAPVDLSQAIIGPGMGIFTRFSSVLEADGSHMSVRTALQLINRYLADDDFDADTRFCLGWFEQFGFASGAFGEADVLAKAKGTSVDGVRSAGVLTSVGGRVQLTKWSDYPPDWDPSTDVRIPVWEVVHHLIRMLRQSGDAAAGRLLAQVQDKAGASRQLIYRLYTLSERAGRAEDARTYNELITSWPAIEAAMATSATAPLVEPTLFDDPA